MPRKGLNNTQLVLISLLVALVLAEFGLRVIYGDKFGHRPGFFIGDQRIGWKPAANLDHTFYGPDFNMKVHTDASGYRLGALGEVDYGKRLVVMLGDSYTFGWGVSTDETCASYLDQEVSEASDGNARVVNLGVGGYGTLQSHERLRRFLDDHADADVAVVVMFHAPNDPVDNVNSIGYHIGFWQVIDKQPKPRSSIHLINFADYVGSVVSNKRGQSFDADEGRINPFLQDVAFAFDYKLPRSLPPTVTLNGHTIRLDNISEADYSKPATVERESMTPIQRELTLEGVRSIHAELRGRSIPIVHGIVASAHPWFIEQMSDVLKEAEADAGIGVDLIGRFPDPAAFGRPYINDHFGKHYTPAFNEYWARQLMTWVGPQL